MFRSFLLIAFVWTSAATLRAEDWSTTYDGLLQKYVANGGVKYEAWHANTADRKALAEVIKGISSQSIDGLDEDAQLAFYLNAYNAWILHTILQDYPTKGPGGGGLFGRNKYFKAKTRKVAGATTSFHLLENQIIRPKFNEPRIHFALNCASKSCPPLHKRAFTGATLDADLDALAKAFINDNPQGVTVSTSGKVVQASKIFDWYAEDFKPGLVAYLNKYRERKLQPDAKVVFQKYHWTLNEAK
jgi:hypothetical protein